LLQALLEVKSALRRLGARTFRQVVQQIDLHINPAATEFDAGKLTLAGEFFDLGGGAFQQFGALLGGDGFFAHCYLVRPSGRVGGGGRAAF